MHFCPRTITHIFVYMLPLIIMVHVIGLYLRCLHKNGHQTVENIFTINLGVGMLTCAIPLYTCGSFNEY